MKREPGELWKYYPYSTLDYLVSSLGRVARRVLNKWKLIIPATDKLGYKRVNIKINKNKSIHVLVHRLVLETFRRKRLPHEVCRHLNGKPSNNELRNIKWGTQQENTDDKWLHGTMPVGEKHHNTSLTNKQACEIACDTRMYRKIAKDYNCTVGTVRGIKTGVYFTEATKNTLRVLDLEPHEGHRNVRAKCTEKLAIKIYTQSGMNNLEISNKYNISEHIVGAIRRGHRYKNVTNGLYLGKPAKTSLSNKILAYVRKSNKSALELAKELNIARSTVYNIRNGNAGY